MPKRGWNTCFFLYKGQKHNEDNIKCRNISWYRGHCHLVQLLCYQLQPSRQWKNNDAMILPRVAWCYANNTERQLLLRSQNWLLWSQLHFCWRKWIQNLRTIAYSSWSCGTCNLMFAFQHFRTSARKTKEIVTDEWPIKAKKGLFWVGILDPLLWSSLSIKVLLLKIWTVTKWRHLGSLWIIRANFTWGNRGYPRKRWLKGFVPTQSNRIKQRLKAEGNTVYQNPNDPIDV